MSTPEIKTLKKEINKTVRALAKKLTDTDDEQIQLELSQQICALMTQRTKLAQKIIKKESAPYKNAIKALKDLTKEVKDAKKDIDKIEKVIAKTSKTVDKVTQFISGLAKISAAIV